MIIELGDNGLRSRYHWSTHDIDESQMASIESLCDCGQSIANQMHLPTCTRVRTAVYLAVRARCPFLTDTNHEWEARDYGPPQSIHHKRLRELQASSRYSIAIREKLSSGEIRYWFHFGYRVPGQPY